MDSDDVPVDDLDMLMAWRAAVGRWRESGVWLPGSPTTADGSSELFVDLADRELVADVLGENEWPRHLDE